MNEKAPHNAGLLLWAHQHLAAVATVMMVVGAVVALIMTWLSLSCHRCDDIADDEQSDQKQ
jgi:hypothetical protein